MSDLFQTDQRHDYEQASDGVSRYGAYLRDRARRFLDGRDRPTTDPVQFAAAAFEIGCAPIMSPPYVRHHPRVLSVAVHTDEHGRRAIRVDLALNLTTALRLAMPSRSRGWDQAASRFADNSLRATGGWDDGNWHEPWDNDQPTVISTLTVRIPLPAEVLPTPVYDQHDRPDLAAAKNAVNAVRVHLNTQLDDLADTITGRWTA